MTTDVILMALCALVLSAVLTGVMRKIAQSHGVLDVPNVRSSHATPTPRGGGIAITITSFLAVVALVLSSMLSVDIALALGGGLAVATVGFIDDHRSVSPGIRLLVHVLAALWALKWLGGLPPVRIGDHIFEFGWEGYALGVLGIIWTLNLFNFMDGIDGIAGIEAVFIAGAGAGLALLAGMSQEISSVNLLFAAACCGFLLWNWPPARIFMGDVGSGFIGYFIAVMALAAAREHPIMLFVWIILGGVFFIDATVTLINRLMRGERVYEAHRSHAYQRLVRRWASHKRVTICVLLVNVCWLLPWAWAAVLNPAYATWMVGGSLLPLTVLIALIGAGRAEDPFYKNRQ